MTLVELSPVAQTTQYELNANEIGIHRFVEIGALASRLYPQTVTPEIAAYTTDLCRVLGDDFEELESGGGKLLWRGSGGKRIVASQSSATLYHPPGWGMPGKIWEELRTDTQSGISENAVANWLAAGGKNELDFGIKFQPLLSLVNVATAAYALKQRKYSQLDLHLQRHKFAGIKVLDLILPNNFRLQFFQLPNFWEEGDQDCRVSWALPFNEAFAGAYVTAGQVYVDEFSRQALASDRVSVSLMRAELAQLTIAAQRFLLNRFFFANAPALAEVKWQDIGGVSAYNVFLDPELWRRAKQRSLVNPLPLQDRELEITVGNLLLFTCGIIPANASPINSADLEIAAQIFNETGLTQDQFAKLAAKIPVEDYRQRFVSGELMSNICYPVMLARQLNKPLAEIITLCHVHKSPTPGVW